MAQLGRRVLERELEVDRAQNEQFNVSGAASLSHLAARGALLPRAVDLPRAPWTADAMGLGDLKLDDMIVVALVGCLAATTLTMTVLVFAVRLAAVVFLLAVLLMVVSRAVGAFLVVV